MRWTAVIPFKGTGERKTRLAGQLSPPERQRLSRQMFMHVVGVLSAVPDLSDIAVLSDQRTEGWTGRLVFDEGRGLNAELRALAESLGSAPLLVIHADLPLLQSDDVLMLLSEAGGGYAIGPDRHASGTNALALGNPRGFGFAFGADSFARHVAAARGRAGVVKRLGLGLDIDTPDDLKAAIAAGFSPDQAGLYVQRL
jgi:2-phospho-L-lactate guanylyltransferase